MAVQEISAANKGIDVAPGEHLIAAFCGKADGPTLIVVGGLHGNEAGGVIALSNLSRQLHEIADQINGRVYFVAGNTRALARGVRFIDYDLNRSWTAKNLSSAGSADFLTSAEGSELTELDELIDSILITARNEVYVLDLHSTSAEGVPFATVGDTLRNRNFAQKFPILIILGIEEQLEGTMLEYLNNAGAVTLGFEGGQHYAPETVANHEALVWTALENTGIITDKARMSKQRKLLARSQQVGRIFEIRYRHAISEIDEFEMDPGYNNFDAISRGQVLARDKRGLVNAVESGVLLMPLYQKLGEDGFFVGRRVSPFWLRLSAILRRIGVQDMVSILPGVRRDPRDRETLIVDTRVARLFPLQVFHLLGFRRRRWRGDKLIVSRRRHDSVSPFLPKGDA
jgi:succinylglutamate desuccinylase